MVKVLKVACIIFNMRALARLLADDYAGSSWSAGKLVQRNWYNEISTFLGFAGLFIYSIMTALSKFKSLVPVKHPFLEESLHHHI